MRYVYLVFAFIVVLAVSLLGFRGEKHTFIKPPLEVFPDMDRQPKYKAQGSSQFFADGRNDRTTPANAVAFGRSAMQADPQFAGLDAHRYKGKNADGSFAKGFPADLPVNHALLERGQNRYNIYCLPCHGQIGDGNGITKAYGMAATPSYHDDRIRNMPEGEIFNTITHGKNTMGAYGDKLTADDRWAVVAYVRALERAQQGRVEDVPESDKAKLGLK